MGRLGEFVRFFRNDDQEAEAASAAMARAALDWMSQDYHARFEAWIDDNASVALDPGANEAQLRTAVVRANTFREIKKHLVLLRKTSEAAVRRDREEREWQSTTMTE